MKNEKMCNNLKTIYVIIAFIAIRFITRPEISFKCYRLANNNVFLFFFYFYLNDLALPLIFKLSVYDKTNERECVERMHLYSLMQH